MAQQNMFFDFDGMKFNTMPAQVEYLNSRYGINTTIDDYIGHNNNLDLIIKKHCPGIKMTRNEIYSDFAINFISSIEWHTNVQPMEDMPEVTRELSKKFNLLIATGRQKRGLPVIQYLLRKYVPGCISLIHCVWEHTEEGSFVGVPKKDFMQKMSGDNIAFFDDSLHEVEDTKDIIPSYLFDPNKIHANTEGLLRVESYKQIGDMFL